MFRKFFSKRFLIVMLLTGLALGIWGAREAGANFMQNAGIQTGGTATTGQTPDNTWLRFAQSVNSDQMNITSWTGFPLISTVNHLTAMIIGYPDATGKIIPRSGALSFLFDLISDMYNQKPSSAQLYLAYVLNNTVFVNSAYAQAWTPPTGPGTDFFPATPILNWWKQIRNIAFVLMIAVMVAIGFMIMFRFKLDPQTTVSVQSSLPKIAVSLILISLSYAVVGLMVDLAYLGINLIGVYILPTAFNMPKDYIITDIFKLMTNFGGAGKDIFSQIGAGFMDLFQLDATSGVVRLIIVMALVSSVAKLFFTLLTKYVTLVLGAVFSPLAFLWGSLPGQYDTIPSFLKGLASAALAFPITMLFLSMAAYFADATNVPTAFKSLEPLSTAIPLAKGSLVFQQIIAIGLLMASANVPQIIDDALSVKPSAVGAGVSEAGGFLRRIPVIGSFLG